MFVGGSQEIRYRPALHILADNEGSAFLVFDVVDGDYVGVTTQPAHGLGLSNETRDAIGAELIGLEKSDDHISIEAIIFGQVDLFLAPMTKRAPNEITAGSKRCRQSPGLSVGAGRSQSLRVNG